MSLAKESTVDASTSTRLPSKAYAAMGVSEDLVPWDFTRRSVRPHDVRVEIKYCGVCHTDIHFIQTFWLSSYPGLHESWSLPKLVTLFQN